MRLNAIRRLDIDPPARRKPKDGPRLIRMLALSEFSGSEPHRLPRLAVPRVTGRRPPDDKTYLVPPPSVQREDFSAPPKAESASHETSHVQCDQSRDRRLARDVSNRDAERGPCESREGPRGVPLVVETRCGRSGDVPPAFCGGPPEAQSRLRGDDDARDGQDYPRINRRGREVCLGRRLLRTERPRVPAAGHRRDGRDAVLCRIPSARRTRVDHAVELPDVADRAIRGARVDR